MTPQERVAAVLAAVATVKDAGSAEGRAVREALHDGPLSPAGTELALSAHLETTADPRWLASLADETRRCHVGLAGNVCVAAARAIAVALAEAPSVRVRPSRRDPHLARGLITLLRRAGIDIEEVERLAPEAEEGVHLYGHDTTLDRLVEALPTGIRLRRFGHGFGVAAAGRHDAPAIAEALVPFDGAGCLSPRLIIATEDVEDVGEAIHHALAASAIPRGPISPEDRAALRRLEDTFTAVGAVHVGEHHLVAIDPAPEALPLLPPLRCTLVVPDATLVDARLVTTVGGAVSIPAPGARRGPIATMQHPPLDGPVDRRPATAPRITG